MLLTVEGNASTIFSTSYCQAVEWLRIDTQVHATLIQANEQRHSLAIEKTPRFATCCQVVCSWTKLVAVGGHDCDGRSRTSSSRLRCSLRHSGVLRINECGIRVNTDCERPATSERTRRSLV